jgi:hypothetical protein
LPVPEVATAQNRPNDGAQVIAFQLLSAADGRAVQVIPSGLVITRLPVPELAEAQNRPNDGAQVIALQLL